MAFPTIAATNTSFHNNVATSHAVLLPAGIVAGNLLLVFLRCPVSGAVSYPAGWTPLFESEADASDDVAAMAWRKADGTEGATVTITHGSGKLCALTWRITDAADPTVTPPEASTVATGNSTLPDPAELTPTGGDSDYLWLALACAQGTGSLTPTWPTGYTLSQIAQGTGVGGAQTTNARVWAGGLQRAAASEDPSEYITNLSSPWMAFTVAIYPAVVAPDGQFRARGTSALFPYGFYQRSRRWSWLWEQITFCLPLNDPVTNNGFQFSDGKFQCWDVGPARMGGSGKRIGGFGSFDNFRRLTTGDGTKLAGNAAISFGNLTNTGAGTGCGLQWDPADGGSPTSIFSGEGFTCAFVYTNTGFGASSRRLVETAASFLGLHEAIEFTPTHAGWTSFLTPLSVAHLGTRRSVWVFTGRVQPDTGRFIYQNGTLLGQDSNSVIGLGDLAIRLGISNLDTAATSSAGILELMLFTNRHWSPEFVRLFSAQPFAFLEPRRRYRSPVDAVVDPCEWFDEATGLWRVDGAGTDWENAAAAGDWGSGSAGDWNNTGAGSSWRTPKEC